MAPTPDLDDDGMYTRVSTSSLGPDTTMNYLQLPKEPYYEDDVFESHTQDTLSASKLSASLISLSPSTLALGQILLQSAAHPSSPSDVQHVHLKNKKEDSVFAGQWIRQRWGYFVTLAIFFMFFVSIGFVNSYGLLYVHLQNEFRSTALETGWVGSLANAMAYLACPLTNHLIIRLRSTRLVVFLGVILCSVGLVTSSFVPSIHYLYGTIGILYGVGLNMIMQSCVVILLQYFPGRNSGRVNSCASLGATTGTLVVSLFLTRSMYSIGWRATLRFYGAGLFVIGSLCCIPLIPAPTDEEQNKELTKEGSDDEKKCLRAVSTDGVNVVSEIEHTKEADTWSTSSSTNSLKSFMKLKITWFAGGAFFLSALAQTFHCVNFVSHLQVVGISGQQGALMMTSIAAGEMAGKVLLAIFGDSIPCRKIYFIAASNLAAAAVTLPVAVVTSVPVLMALSACLGFVRSGFQALTWSAGVEIFGISRVYEATATIMLSSGGGFVLGATATGMSYDYTGNYIISIIIATGLHAISGILFISIPLRDQWIRYRQARKLQREFDTPLPPHAVPILRAVDRNVILQIPKVVIDDIVSVV